MRKTIVFCVLTSLAFADVGSARSISPHPPSHKSTAFLPRASSEDENKFKRLTRAPRTSSPHKMRGGDLGPISTLTLSKLFSGLVSLDGISGSLAPSAVCELFNVSVPKASFIRFCVEAMGGIALNLAVTSFLAATKRTSVEKAIGYGLLARLFFSLRAVITNSEHTTKTIVMPFKCFYFAAVPYCFLSGSKIDPWVAVKIWTLLSLLAATYNYLNPSGGASLFFGGDLDKEGETTKEMYRLAAGYDIVGNAYMLMLSQGVDPIDAVGYASFLTALWMIDLAYFKKNLYDLFGGVPFFNMQSMTFIVLFFSALSGGILLDAPTAKDASE